MRFSIMFCILLTCFHLGAQTKIVSGYYINMSGDTVKGKFPKYTQWSRNPDKVEFIPAGSTNSLQLTPAICSAFSIEGYDDYIAFSGERLLNPIEDDVAINNANFFPDARDSISSVTGFLRLVTKTPLCEIYILNDQVRRNFYCKLPGQTIKELKFKTYFSEGTLHEVTEYKAQLNGLFAEEISKKNLVKKLGELPYTEEGIENFIEQLSGITKAKQKNKNAGWTVLAGMSINFFDVTGDLSLQEVTSTFNTSSAPFISTGFILPISRNFNRFFMYPQVRVYNFKNSSSYSTTYSKRTITYHSQLCILPEVNGGINIVNTKDLRLFLYGGGGMLFLMKNRETNKKTNLADGSGSSYDIPTAKITYSCNVTGGVLIGNRIMITSSYHVPVQVANFAMYSSMHSSLQIGVGYKFK